MTYNNPLMIHEFFRCSPNGKAGTWGRTVALLTLSTALLSSVSFGQGPTVTLLPYVLANQPGQVTITLGPQVIQNPAANTGGGFASLLGGGFASLLTEPAAAAATATAVLSVRKALSVTKATALKNHIVKLQNDTQAAQQKEQEEAMEEYDVKLQNDEDICLNTNVVNSKLVAKLLGNRGSARLAGKLGSAKLVAHAAGATCELPQEQNAQQAEEELQALNESEEASQEAIEAAEEAAEAAEAAAQAAEDEIEALEIGFDVLEGLLDVAEVALDI